MYHEIYIGKDKYRSAQSFVKEINNTFNIRLNSFNVHTLLNYFGLKPIRNPHMNKIQMYSEHDVYSLFKGSKSSQVRECMYNLNKIGSLYPKPTYYEKESDAPMPKIDDYKEEPKEIEDINYPYYYEDSANDNDAYSKHLINNVYQFESKSNSGKKIIIKEDTFNRLFENTQQYSVWYRGHDGNVDALANFGIIWLTDDIEYAQEYANHYGSEGVVSEITIDNTKIKESDDLYYYNDFDFYFPSDKILDEYKSDGFNAYYFVADEDIQCLALLSEKPVVNVRVIDNIE